METELENTQTKDIASATSEEQTEFDWGDEEEDKKRPFQNISATGVLNRIGDILLLHFAVLICSLPIVTIGASMSAGTYVGMKLASGTEGGVLGSFIKGFKENFKRGTIYFLTAVAGFFVIYNSYRYWMSVEGGIGKGMAYVSVGLAVAWVMFVLYVFAVQAKFENTLIATAKNAILMAVRHFHITALMVFVIAVAVWLFMEFMAVQALMAVSGFGIMLFVMGKLYNIVFKCYIN
ncbi:MAG: YesL family protein [Lachnospiraceae bacterium]|nr:YesL family protein [Lachnospiraceae bacterium]